MVENTLIPRQPYANVVASLFGSSDSAPRRNTNKRGRTPGKKNSGARRNPDCPNKGCSRWFDCQGGQRRYMCQWDKDPKSGFFNISAVKKRRKAFDKLLRSDPNITREEGALQVHIS